MGFTSTTTLPQKWRPSVIANQDVNAVIVLVNQANMRATHRHH